MENSFREPYGQQGRRWRGNASSPRRRKPFVGHLESRELEARRDRAADQRPGAEAVAPAANGRRGTTACGRSPAARSAPRRMSAALPSGGAMDSASGAPAYQCQTSAASTRCQRETSPAAQQEIDRRRCGARSHRRDRRETSRDSGRLRDAARGRGCAMTSSRSSSAGRVARIARSSRSCSCARGSRAKTCQSGAQHAEPGLDGGDVGPQERVGFEFAIEPRRQRRLAGGAQPIDVLGARLPAPRSRARCVSAKRALDCVYSCPQ